MKFSSTARTFVLGAVTVLSIGGALAAGCSSSSVTPNAPDSAGTCPATFDGANAAACHNEGFMCSYEYPCEGTLYQAANCTCSGGTYQCFDQVSGTTPIAAGSEPQCLTPTPIKLPCPTSFATGDGVACSDPGGVCTYPGQICNGTQTFNICQCVSGGNSFASDGGLAFKCEQAICNTEAGAVQPPADAGSDASDAGSD